MTEFDYTDMTPANTRKAANLAAESIRYLNHATLGTSTPALKYSSDVDAILVDLDALGERLPQLLDQLGAWEAAECAAGRLRVALPGAQSPSAEAAAVAAMRQRLDTAADDAKAFRRAVHDARQITATLAEAPEPRPRLWAHEPQEGETGD